MRDFLIKEDKELEKKLVTPDGMLMKLKINKEGDCYLRIRNDENNVSLKINKENLKYLWVLLTEQY